MLKKLFRRRPLIEELEPRLLFSADLAPLALDVFQPAPEQRVLTADGEFAGVATRARNELVFVDAGVQDYETLLADIFSQAGDGRLIEVVVLDAHRDGIEQISDVLKQTGNLDALHLITHGESGVLQLGNNTLDAAGLDARSADIAAWGAAFNADADLLVYGCDVASGTEGDIFVRTLSRLTGADVAASDDRTGNTALGGDWVLEFQSGRIESMAVLDAAGRAQWQGVLEIPVNTSTGFVSKYQQDAAVAASASGSYVVTWTSQSQDGNGDGIYGQRFDANGNALGAEFRVNTSTNGSQRDSSVGMAADGSFVVVWASDDAGSTTDNAGWGIHGQRFNASGAMIGSEFLVNATTPGSQETPSIAVASDGTFMVSWRSDQSTSGDIYARIFDAGGNALSAEFRVNTTTAGNQDMPQVATDSGNNFIVAWQSDTAASGKDIFVQGYASLFGWAPWGSEILVNAGYTVNDQTLPAIAMAGNAFGGIAALTWTSDDADGKGVYATIIEYGVGGLSPIVTAPVNSTTTKEQTHSSIAVSGTNQVTVSWMSKDQDGNDLGVYTRGFTYNQAAGTLSPGGGEILVNSTVDKKQQLPSLALISTGNYAIVWDGNGAGDGDGVFMQVYVDTHTPPIAYPDNATTDQNTPHVAPAPGLLSNDVDPDSGEVLSVYAIKPGGASVSTPVTAGGVTVGGIYGDLLVKADGSYTYTPNANARTLGAGQTGTDVFLYSIHDTQNTSASSTLTLTVDGLNDAPILASAALSLNEGDTVTLSGASFGITDPDDSSFAYSLSAISGGYFQLGSAAGIPITAFSSADLSSGLVQFVDDGNEVAPSFNVTVNDGDVDSNTLVATITYVPVNSPPSTTPVTLAAIAEDSGARLITQAELLADASDSDGPGLTATALAIVSGGGTLLDNLDGTWTYTPASNDDTAVSFGYMVTDGALAVAGTASLDITPVNDAPVAVDATINTTEDVVYTGTLPFASDVDGDAVSYALDSAAANGTASVNADGTFTYAPPLHFFGPDSFTFAIADGNGGAHTYTATVNVAAVNDAPTATGTASLAAIQEDDAAPPGATVADLFAANFSNPEDAGASSQNQFAGVAVRGQSVNPSQGRWQFSTDDGASWNNFGLLSDATAISLGLSDRLRFLPAANYNGTPNALSVRLLDNSVAVTSGGAIDVSINGGTTAISGGLVPLATEIAPVNDAPVATPVDLGTIAEDGSRVITQADLLAGASDQEGDGLIAINLTLSTGSGTLGSNADNSWTFTPSADWNGAASFAFAIDDGTATTATTASLAVNPVNDAPAIPSTATVAVAENAPFSVVLTATDIEGDALGYAISGGADAAWFSLDPATGELRLNALPDYDAPLDANGDNVYEVIVTVSDGQGGTASQTLYVAVLPVAEAAAPIADPTPEAPAAVSEEPPATEAATKQTAEPTPLAPAQDTTLQAASRDAAEDDSGILAAGTGLGNTAAGRPTQGAFTEPLRTAAGTAPASLLVSLNQALGALASDARALQMLQTSLDSGSFQQQLDQLQEAIRQQLSLDKNTVASTLAVSTGLSVGYVLWLIRGGVLLSSLLTSLPAWRLIDPLPILGQLATRRNDDDRDDDDSLENMLKQSNARSASTPEVNDGNAP